MTDEPKKQTPYEHWVAERRAASPAADLSDQIMDQISELKSQRPSDWWLSLVEQIESKPGARWAVCGGALMIGGSPFLFLANVAKFLTF